VGNREKRLCIGICIHKGLAVFMQMSSVTFEGGARGFPIRFSEACNSLFWSVNEQYPKFNDVMVTHQVDHVYHSDIPSN
jgi:hypothetical protein